MEMTTSEIVKSFREAKDRRKQMSILADLNTCTVPEIKAELEKGGVNWREFPRAGGKHRVKSKATSETTAEIALTPPESIIAITAPVERINGFTAQRKTAEAVEEIISEQAKRETAFIAEPIGSNGTSTAEQANIPELIPKEVSDAWVEQLKNITFQKLPETEIEYEPKPESNAGTIEAINNLLDAMRTLADSVPSTIVAMAKATKAIAQSEIKNCEETIAKLKGIMAQSDATITKYGKQEAKDEDSKDKGSN